MRHGLNSLQKAQEDALLFLRSTARLRLAAERLFQEAPFILAVATAITAAATAGAAAADVPAVAVAAAAAAADAETVDVRFRLPPPPPPRGGFPFVLPAQAPVLGGEVVKSSLTRDSRRERGASGSGEGHAPSARNMPSS